MAVGGGGAGGAGAGAGGGGALWGKGGPHQHALCPVHE